jgi:BirA family transcriptional regulator, biotin operon repressor / biotin---[acetyl-CoA-carboxylase] ligase
MIDTPFLARRERFAIAGSTNDIVRDWLAAGEPEICLAIADEQSAGRGREGRTWSAPPGRALLLSLGFRPTWVAPERVWQLAGTVSLAMAEAAERVAALVSGAIRLKWPNDLVLETAGVVRKLAGVLGETDGLGGDDPRAVIGIGINADWPAREFPLDLAETMTSLREASGGGSIEAERLLDTFLTGLEPRIEALRGGSFDADGWTERQLTTGRLVRLVGHDGLEETVRAVRSDPSSGALVVADPLTSTGERAVVSGEIRHVRLDGAV